MVNLVTRPAEMTPNPERNAELDSLLEKAHGALEAARCAAADGEYDVSHHNFGELAGFLHDAAATAKGLADDCEEVYWGPK